MENIQTPQDNVWTEVTIFTSTAGIDIVTELLDRLEIYGYALEDAADFEEFLQDTEIYWDYVDEDLCAQLRGQETKIKIYLATDDTGAAQYAQLLTLLADTKAQDEQNAWGRLTTQTASTSQADWEWGWKQYFKPFPVGKQFIIKPSWETVDDTHGRRILEIDPASSFGTGSHDTTQLCIGMLEDAVQGGEKVLDMGTGSGILAVTAALLGAKPAVYVDIDAHCLLCAQENAERNHVEIGTGLHGDALRNPQLVENIGDGFDIICANIVADIIIGMAPMFLHKLNAGGTLITSGIIDHRAQEVQEALLAAGFVIYDHQKSNDWWAFGCKKG